MLLRALAALFAERDDCLALLVADGALRAEMEALAARLGLAERLVRLDHVPDPREVYEACDAFVLTSRYEGLPYVMLEAMSMGLPVIASRIPGCADVIEEGETGLLVEPGSVADAARAMRTLAGDGALRNRIGAAGQASVRHEYTLENFITRTQSLYTRLAGIERQRNGTAKNAKDAKKAKNENGH